MTTELHSPIEAPTTNQPTLSSSGEGGAPPVPGHLAVRWELKKIVVTIVLPKSGTKLEFTIIAKVYGGVAIHPVVVLNADGTSIRQVKDSFSITAVACRYRFTWTRTEEDAMKIAYFLASNFAEVVAYRTTEKVMAAFPPWVGAWIKECRKEGSSKGGYVDPPSNQLEINSLMEKYQIDERRGDKERNGR